MIWVVVVDGALGRFEVENPSDEDAPLRIHLTAWALLLQITGPPSGGVLDDRRQLWDADIPTLPVKVRYLVLRGRPEPIIVVRAFIRY